MQCYRPTQPRCLPPVYRTQCLPYCPAPTCTASPDPPLPTLDYNKAVCGEAYSVSLKVPFEANAEPRETAVATFDTSKYQGFILPVSEFQLDDFAFIVKADFDIKTSYSLNGNTRSITLPPETMVIVDGKNPNYASGAVDDMKNTNYVFNGKSYSIPGGISIPLSEAIKGVINLGVPHQPHDSISLDLLTKRGFLVNNKVSFKIMHVAHGAGDVTLSFAIPQC